MAPDEAGVSLQEAGTATATLTDLYHDYQQRNPGAQPGEAWKWASQEFERRQVAALELGCRNAATDDGASGYRPIYGILNETQAALLQNPCQMNGIPCGDLPDIPYVEEPRPKQWQFTEQQVNLLSEISEMYLQNQVSLNVDAGIGRTVTLTKRNGRNGVEGEVEGYDTCDSYVAQEDFEGRTVNICQVPRRGDLDGQWGSPLGKCPSPLQS